MSAPHSPPPATQQGQAFRRLCQQGHVELLGQMLHAGMHVDAAQEDGCTGLWLAAEAGNVEAVRFLCGHKANVNATKASGNVTALYIATQNGHAPVVEALLQQGANPNAAKSTGSTPVFIAAQQGFNAILRALLRAGANCNTPNHQGITPLMIAAYQGNVDCVAQLLSSGADPYQTGQGKNALEWAQSGGHRAAVQQTLDRHLHDVERQVQRRHEVAAAAASAVGVSATASTLQHRPGGGGGGSAGSNRGQPGASGSGGGGGVAVYLPYGESPATATAGGAAAGWYTPQFLARSPSRRPAAADLHANESSRRIPPRSVSVVSLTTATAAALPFESPALSTAYGSGFSGGGLTPMVVAEEERRQRHFRAALQRERSNQSTAALGADATATTVATAQRAFAVEQEWEIHKARLLAARRELEASADEVREGWMRSVAATTHYAERNAHINDERRRAARQNAEQDAQQSAAMRGDGGGQRRGFAFPTLPREKLNSLEAFMQRGAGAKGPPPPPPPPDVEDGDFEGAAGGKRGGRAAADDDPYAVQDAIVLPTSAPPPGRRPSVAAGGGDGGGDGGAVNVEGGGSGAKMSALQRRLAERAKKKAP